MISFTSLRSFLTINLLLGVMLAISCATIINLSFNHRTLHKDVDSKLILYALDVHALISDNPNIKSIQSNLNNIPLIWQRSYWSSHRFKLDLAKVHFQIWDKNGRLLLHSCKSIDTLLTTIPRLGFSDINIGHNRLRTFAYKDPVNEYTIATTEHNNSHEELENHLARNLILIILATTICLAFLIKTIVNHGIGSIKKVIDEIKNRDPYNLKPVGLDKIPTEIRPLAQELNNLFAIIQTAFDREKHFTSDVSHELRTPLSIIQVQAQVALNATTETERTPALRAVVRGIERCSHAVQQLLILNRSLRESSYYPKTTLNLSAQTAKVIAALFPSANEKNINIELMSPKKPQLIIGHDITLEILLNNLLDNAIRYTQANGIIKVIIASCEHNVMLHIIDNGIGIADKYKDKVFERFYKVETDNDNTQNIGLGLSIVKQIVRIHNGTIKLLTPPSNRGLEVIVTFPKAFK